MFTRQLAAERWACRIFLKKSGYPAERRVRQAERNAPN